MTHQAKLKNKKVEVLVWAVCTCWNTVMMVLEHTLDLEPVLFDVCDKAEFNQAQGVRLCQFILEQEEWAIICKLYELLAVCSVCALLSRLHVS